MAVFAVFDVIDSLRGKYEKAMAGDIKARVNVLGRTSEYAFAVTELSSEESIRIFAASDNGAADGGGKAAVAALYYGQRAVSY